MKNGCVHEDMRHGYEEDMMEEAWRVLVLYTGAGG